ncbi:TIGR04372 family glycosyltransferase [Dongia sp.]|uniref:TIGR04372 family glycosyltransferase n=1 Tax=Dongia sp. TaxID=1977262 RepID=UPI0035B198D9
METHLFDKSRIGPSELFRRIGYTAERPFLIYAPIIELTLGDFIGKIAFLATLKNQFDHAILDVRFRDTRPYLRDIIALAPNIDRALPLVKRKRSWVEKLLRLPKPTGTASLDVRKGRRHAFYDIVVTDWMADARNVHGLPGSVPLRIPPALAPSLEEKLIRLGLDPNRWVAAIHYRESSYAWRKRGEDRDSDPREYERLAHFIIDKLGGQVVRLGHPEMGPFTPREGLLDLSRIPGSFMLQAAAVSHARFVVAGPSGGVAMGWGFHVPTGLVDAVDALGGWGPMHQVVLTHEVTTADGRRLRNRDLLDSGLLCRFKLRQRQEAGETFGIRKNSSAELSAVAAHLYDATSEISAWRPPAPMPSVPVRPNHVVWPPQTRENLAFLDV